MARRKASRAPAAAPGAASPPVSEPQAPKESYLREILAGQGESDDMVYIYRTNPDKPALRESMGNWVGSETPSIEWMYRMWGPGRYLVVVHFGKASDREDTSTTLNLPKNYMGLDAMVPEPGGNGSQPVSIYNQPPQGQSFSDMLKALTQMVEVIRPLLPDPAAQPSGLEMLEGVQKAMELQQRIMTVTGNRMMKQLETMGEPVVPTETVEEQSTDWGAFVEKAMPYVEKLLPKLLGPNGGTVAEGLKALPDVAQILESPELVTRFFQAITDRIGVTEAKRLAKKLNITLSEQ